MSDKDVEKLLEVVVALRGADFITKWLSAQSQLSSPPPSQSRGRKPGAAAEEIRCSWKPTEARWCKNGRAPESVYCRIHIGKAHLLSSDASPDSVSDA